MTRSIGRSVETRFSVRAPAFGRVCRLVPGSNILLISGDEELLAINLVAGTVAWSVKRRTGENVRNGDSDVVFVHGDGSLWLSEDGRRAAELIEHDGGVRLSCFDIATGLELWSRTIPKPPREAGAATPSEFGWGWNATWSRFAEPTVAIFGDDATTTRTVFTYSDPSTLDRNGALHLNGFAAATGAPTFAATEVFDTQLARTGECSGWITQGNRILHLDPARASFEHIATAPGFVPGGMSAHARNEPSAFAYWHDGDGVSVAVVSPDGLRPVGVCPWPAAKSCFPGWFDGRTMAVNDDRRRAVVFNADASPPFETTIDATPIGERGFFVRPGGKAAGYARLNHKGEVVAHLPVATVGPIIEIDPERMLVTTARGIMQLIDIHSLWPSASFDVGPFRACIGRSGPFVVLSRTLDTKDCVEFGLLRVP